MKNERKTDAIPRGNEIFILIFFVRFSGQSRLRIRMARSGFVAFGDGVGVGRATVAAPFLFPYFFSVLYFVRVKVRRRRRRLAARSFAVALGLGIIAQNFRFEKRTEENYTNKFYENISSYCWRRHRHVIAGCRSRFARMPFERVFAVIVVVHFLHFVIFTFVRFVDIFFAFASAETVYCLEYGTRRANVE